MLQLYKNIKARRLELKITQTELAKRVGYADKGMISRVENGKIDLPQSQIEKFAKALDTTARSLMGWDEPTLPPELHDSYIKALNDYTKNPYYLDENTAKIAQEIFDNKDLRILFDAARDAKPQDLKMAADMLKRFKETNPDG